MTAGCSTFGFDDELQFVNPVKLCASSTNWVVFVKTSTLFCIEMVTILHHFSALLVTKYKSTAADSTIYATSACVCDSFCSIVMDAMMTENGSKDWL